MLISPHAAEGLSHGRTGKAALDQEKTANAGSLFYTEAPHDQDPREHRQAIMTDLELYRRLLDLLRESSLSKREKLDVFERASKVVKEEAAENAAGTPTRKNSRK